MSVVSVELVAAEPEKEFCGEGCFLSIDVLYPMVDQLESWLGRRLRDYGCPIYF